MSQSSEYSIPTPKTPTRHNCNRDDRIRIQALFYDARFSKPQIVLQLNLTIDQVKYALRHRTTPQKQPSGRRPFLGSIERKQLINWVCASRKNRRTPWDQIPKIFGWDCKVYAMQIAFKKEVFDGILLSKSLNSRRPTQRSANNGQKNT
jgi:hypothetical protein